MAGRVIVEGFVEFDYEITLLTVRHVGGTSFCAPIGHVQEDGDYRESWQPQPMSEAARAEAERMAGAITGALGGHGVFGVECFVKGDAVIFSEVSPRPHDTGLVTLVSQDLSEFALHARAILGLPVPVIRQLGPSASCAVLVRGKAASRSTAAWTARWPSPTPRADVRQAGGGRSPAHGGDAGARRQRRARARKAVMPPRACWWNWMPIDALRSSRAVERAGPGRVRGRPQADRSSGYQPSSPRVSSPLKRRL